MSEEKISKLKKDFKDRLFFYPADALYLLELAKYLHLPEEESYRLFSVMGAAELRNTLPLYTSDDFQHKKIVNLSIELPKKPQKIKLLLDNLIFLSNKNISKNPNTFGMLSDSKQAFQELFKIIIENPLSYEKIRIIPATTLSTLDENENNYSIILYGFNPLNDRWISYIRRNKRKVKTIQEHNNQLFSNLFGFFALSSIPDSENIENFIRKSILNGLTAIETHKRDNEYFNRPETLKKLIEEFGLFETGGISEE